MFTKPRPSVKLIKQSAMNPATVVMEEPTTDVSVFPIATAIFWMIIRGFFLSFLVTVP